MRAIPLAYNFRNLFVRWVSTTLTVVCVGLVIGVFVAAMALAEGLEETLRSAGREDNWIVMRTGADAEMQSTVSRDAALVIVRQWPGIAKGTGGEPLFSAEVVVLRNMPRHDGTKVNVPIRGVSPAAFELRPELSIVAGRSFRPSQGEVIVSQRLARRFPEKDLGATFRMARREWTVVGHFDARGASYESEIWADVNDVREAFERNDFSSATFRAESASAGAEIARRIKDDKRIRAEAKTERAYYESQTSAAAPILGLGTALSLIMAVGAASAGMITMFAAVSSRSRDIGTLRSIGFTEKSILASFLAESVMIALAGGVLGCGLALLRDGVTTQTTNFTTFSEVGFAFRVTPKLLSAGLVFAFAIGIAGGYLPARAAMRIPIAAAVRGK
jgi:putative ABC transport system permease protein